ncbi:36397_t:CDS:1, partial [Gigaspora margarita]
AIRRKEGPEKKEIGRFFLRWLEIDIRFYYKTNKEKRRNSKGKLRKSEMSIKEKVIEILYKVCESFISDFKNLVCHEFDKIGFNSDWNSRTNEIARIVGSLRAEFEENNICVNIAVWNMYLNVSERFNHILVSGVSKHGKGGGYRVVIFKGDGSLTNHSEGGYSNWRCYGNLTKAGNTISFNHVRTPKLSTIRTGYTAEASYITPYYSMNEHTQIVSPNGEHRLVMQTDGNLVLYSGSTAIWASNTCGKGAGPYRMALQTDGNLVVYAGNGLPMWASNTYKKQVSYLAVQNDANVVLYDRNWNAKWARTW